MSFKMFKSPKGTNRTKWFKNYFKGLTSNVQQVVLKEICELIRDDALKSHIIATMDSETNLNTRQDVLNKKAIQDEERALQDEERAIPKLYESLERKNALKKYENAKFAFTSKELKSTFQFKSASYDINDIVYFMIEENKYIVSKKIPFISAKPFDKFLYAFRLYICKRNFDKFAVEFKNIRSKMLYQLVQEDGCDIDKVVCANTGTKIGYVINTNNVNTNGEFETIYKSLYDGSTPLLFKNLENTFDKKKQQNKSTFDGMDDYEKMENEIECITTYEDKANGGKMIVLSWLNEL